MKTEERSQLIRGLTLTGTTSLVVGTIIGTGLFLKTAVMSQNVGTPELVLLAWVAAGVLSLAGALTYAELGVLLPRAGGEYVYLREAYGNAPAFLYGWMRFVVGSTGSIASLAAGFAIFFTSFFGFSEPWLTRNVNVFGQDLIWKFGPAQIVAVGIIMTFSLINCAGVAFGGRVQSLLTVAQGSRHFSDCHWRLYVHAECRVGRPPAGNAHAKSDSGSGVWSGNARCAVGI